jgi:hypothetical protein
MHKLGFLLMSLALMLAGSSLLACTSSLCAGTHGLSAPGALYTGCTKGGGMYVTANLTINCQQTLSSGTGTGTDTAAGVHQCVIIDQSTQQSTFAGSEYPIPNNGNGFACNLSCSGSGANAPLYADFCAHDNRLPTDRRHTILRQSHGLLWDLVLWLVRFEYHPVRLAFLKKPATGNGSGFFLFEIVHFSAIGLRFKTWRPRQRFLSSFAAIASLC